MNRYKDERTRYGGDITESWHESLQEYEVVSRNFVLSSEEKLVLLPNILKGTARHFYVEHILGKVSSFEAAEQAISYKFNDGASQHATKNYLSSLHLRELDNYNSAPREALTRLNGVIERNFVRTPTSFQTEENKIDILRDAVVDLDWTQFPLAMLQKQGLDYQKFYSELAHALQTAVDGNRFAPSSTTQSNNTNPEAWWQRQYTKPNRPSGWRGSKFRKGTHSSHKGVRCWNCGEHGHKKADCTNSPADPRQAAVNVI